MSEKRLAVVKHAWQSFGKKEVAWEALRQAYHVDAHPRVRTREKRAEQVSADFADSFGKIISGGVVTEANFIEYYADINATLPSEKDDYFVDLVLKSWGLDAKTTVTTQRLDDLQTVIFEKIRQKTHGLEDEGRTVKKIFKHFDLDGFGTIEYNEFVKALETLGCFFKEAELQGLFKRFDANGNGKIDYEEFAGLIALMGSGNNPNVNPVFGAKREPPHQVIDKVLQTLKARGHHGVRSLGIVFRRIDKSKDHKLDRVEFTWGLRENGHVLTPSEFERVFKFFDRNNEGRVDYIDFLTAVRKHMNARRSAVVAAAYQKLHHGSGGAVTLDTLKAAFDPSAHPRFKSGKITKEQIVEDFVAQWDSKDFSSAAFEDYYTDVSATFDDDGAFETFVKNTWRL